MIGTELARDAVAQISIRTALPSDRVEFVDMAQALYVEDVVGEAMSIDKAQATFAHLAAFPDKGQILVAERGGNTAGYLIVIWFWSNEFGGDVAIIDEIYVRPQFRKAGIATALIDELIRVRPQLRALELEVSPENASAKRWYLARGFVEQRNCHLRRGVRTEC